MKLLIRYITVLILTWAGTVGAQQLPQYTHYVLNYFQQNPAVAGTKSCLALNLGYREQWVGFEGAPKTAFVNLHGKFGESRFNFHGVGALVETDDTGPLSFTSVAFAYAYHGRVNRKAMLSFGASVGFMQYRVDLGAITLPQTGTLNDPALNQGRSTEFVVPQIDFGMMYYKEDRFIGVTIRQLTRNTLGSVGINSRIQNHFILAGGKVIKLDGSFTFKPSFNLRYTAQSKPALDITAMMDYSEKVALGIGLRNGNGVSGLFRVNLYRYIDVGYAYDFTVSKIRFDGRHTHELVLGIKACGGNEGQAIPCSAYD